MILKDNIKNDFPIFQRKFNDKELVYLDTAATAHKPYIVINAISEFYSTYYGTVHRGLYGLSKESSNAYLAARRLNQELINASRCEEIIFSKGTTTAINTLARSVAKTILNKGDSVIISDVEHHANSVSWKMICDEYGLELCIASSDENGLVCIEEIEKFLQNGAKFVSIVHISNVFGSVNDIKKIAEIVHQYDALLCVDAAQSVPHMPIDVIEMGVDFLVFSGHKIYGPTGIGILYGKYDLLCALEPIEGGGDMVNEYSKSKLTFNPVPYKFEAGTPLIAQAIGLGAAIQYVQAMGLKNIFAHERVLVKKAIEGLQNISGIHIFGSLDCSNRGSLISFSIDGVHPMDLAIVLDLQGIALRTGNVCNQPSMAKLGLDSVIRISVGVYNTEADIEIFLYELSNAVKVLKEG